MTDQLLYRPPCNILPGDAECKERMGQFYDAHTLNAAHNCESWYEFIHNVEDVKLRIASLDASICYVNSITGNLWTKVVDVRRYLSDMKQDGMKSISDDVVTKVGLNGSRTEGCDTDSGPPTTEQHGLHIGEGHIKQGYSLKRGYTHYEYATPCIQRKNSVAQKSRMGHFDLHHDASTFSSMTKGACKGKQLNFPTMRELSKKDMSMLSGLFSEKQLDEDTSSCQMRGLSSSPREIRCLSPSIPLSFKVINIVTAYLSESEPKCWYLPTFFGYGPSKVQGWVGSTINKCRLQRFHRRLQYCSKIFIPLHDHLSDHWYLLVVNLDERNFELLDSFPDRRLHNQLNPIHEDNVESEIYVIRHMQYHGQKWYTQFDPLIHQNLVALDIVKHPKNHVTNPIQAPASNLIAPVRHSARNTVNSNAMQLISGMSINGRKCHSHRLRRSRA
ncbi:hypothetical protein M0R45_016004 [Rubus argutus]|uniref:Ubiquitin-like protease family profile domain-containing protein n=1 Tax=Rubus argutus TaxID=59490 RepID=A0AAW1XRC0_RUBAR